MTALAETRARTTCGAYVTCLTIFFRGLTLAIVVNNVTARREARTIRRPGCLLTMSSVTLGQGEGSEVRV